MGISDLEKKIIEDAEAEAEKIKLEAEKKAAQIEKEYRQKAEANYERIIKEAHAKADALKKSILVPARLDAKKAILAAKHEILDEVFKDVSPQKREENLEKAAKLLFE